MKRLINILLLIFGITVVFIVTSGIIKFECPFKVLFDICCPGCGLTRSFRAIFNLDFTGAFNYNILGIPLFITGIITCVGFIIDAIKNNNKTTRLINNILTKYYVYIIIIVGITMIINNIRGI